MPVPDYQSLMAPVLSALADCGDHSLAELRTVLAQRLGLTEEDLQAKIPSGTPLFANRLHWAVTYMHQAGLVSRPKRGVVRITGRGRKVAAAHPERVDVGVLSEFLIAWCTATWPSMTMASGSSKWIRCDHQRRLLPASSAAHPSRSRRQSRTADFATAWKSGADSNEAVVATRSLITVIVFISSVRRGLEDERDYLPALLKASGHQPRRFEDFSA
jgi:hypothetical protein